MPSLHSASALAQYQHVGVIGSTGDATPHRLVAMLMGGALDRLTQARGHLHRQDMPQKLRGIGSAIAIVEHLRMTLDFAAGGEIAHNLSRLYDYMLRRMMQANAENDGSVLDEVMDLLRTLKSGWDELPPTPATRH